MTSKTSKRHAGSATGLVRGLKGLSRGLVGAREGRVRATALATPQRGPSNPEATPKLNRSCLYSGVSCSSILNICILNYKRKQSSMEKQKQELMVQLPGRWGT
jgi:hypothetical protein